MADMDAMLRAMRPKIVRYCNARLAGASGFCADDVAQEVCIALWSALPRYRDMGRSVTAFAYGIAAHKVADARRLGARLAVPTADLPEVPDELPGPEELALAHCDADRVRDLLAELPPHLRKLLMLRVVSGLTAAETGELLGMTPAAVRVAQHRALGQLRALATAV